MSRPGSITLKHKIDYYPFGMMMPGRSYNNGDYKYGFNGMEKDDEVKGEGNSYTTLFRQYNPRIGRWFSIDPLYYKFPLFSPYIGMDNNPILLSDPNGDCTSCELAYKLGLGAKTNGGEPLVVANANKGGVILDYNKRNGTTPSKLSYENEKSGIISNLAETFNKANGIPSSNPTKNVKEINQSVNLNFNGDNEFNTTKLIITNTVITTEVDIKAGTVSKTISNTITEVNLRRYNGNLILTDEVKEISNTKTTSSLKLNEISPKLSDLYDAAARRNSDIMFGRSADKALDNFLKTMPYNESFNTMEKNKAAEETIDKIDN